MIQALLKHLLVISLLVCFYGCDENQSNPLSYTEWHSAKPEGEEYLDFEKGAFASLYRDSSATCFSVSVYYFSVDGDEFFVDGIGGTHFKIDDDSLYITDLVGNRTGYIRFAINDSLLGTQVCPAD